MNMKDVESASFNVIYKGSKGDIHFQIKGTITEKPFLINGLYEKKKEKKSIMVSYHGKYATARLYLEELLTYLLVSYRKTRIHAVLSGMELLGSKVQIVQ